MKRPTCRASMASHESTELGEKLPSEQEGLVAYMEQEEAIECEDLEVDDEELMSGAGAAHGGGRTSSSVLGEKKRRLGLEQVRALERNFEKDNKLDPDRKARLAHDLGLQPRQVAVWFQNRRARWKTKQLERDFGALRSRHDALRAECDVLRRDKEALVAEIRELSAKVEKSQMAVKLEAIDAAEERPTTAAAAAVYKDGSSDSDSSVVFNDDASPYSGAVFDQQQPCFMGFTSFINSSTATTSSSFPMFETKCHGVHKGGGFIEEGLLGSDELGGASFFAEEHLSNLAWCGTEGWE